MVGLGCSAGAGAGTVGGAGTTGGTTGTNAGGTAGATGAAGTGPTTDCTFTVTAGPSAKIGTVGIVTWSTTLASPTEAHINFGLDTSYGMIAPVDLTAAPNFRTLLLGMKASRTYHYQLVATGSAGTCASADYTLATGPLPNGLLPTLTITTNDKPALYGGFLITGQYVQSASAAGAPAYILDGDGDFVWWYTIPNSDATGVTMSYDGNYMWINAANVPMTQGTHVHRVSMDGLADDDYTSQFSGLSHQLTVLPDETVAFYAYNSSSTCDDIKLRSPSGAVTTVVNARTAHGGTAACHVNAIFYSNEDDTLVFSDLDNNCLTKVTRTGATVWVLNGGVGGITSSFDSGNIVWKGGEHGFHILGLDDFVIFNNDNSMPAGTTVIWSPVVKGDDTGSIAIEVKLDLTAMTTTQTWSYKASPKLDDTILGDVQRLPNGNTLVDYATKGAVQEVDRNGNLLQQIKTNASFGYLQKRATLYGPPPR